MKITKLGHACLLVEMPDRTALFDPGMMSAVNVDSLKYLDDIIITHEHGDHLDLALLKHLNTKFPRARVIAPAELADKLAVQGIAIADEPVAGVEVFAAPHENVEPLYPHPENVGFHYLDKLTHPGDSLHFNQSKDILALPIAAPWGSTVDALNLAIKLQPKYVIPIHDWHWHDEARQGIYDDFARLLAAHSITFIKPENGKAFNVAV